MKPRWLVSGVVAILLAMLPAGAAFAQPGNDDLASATPVTALPFTDTVDVGDATLEVGEPDNPCAPVHATVWFAMTLERSKSVAVDTVGSDFDTVLAVYQGTEFGDLTMVACNDDADDLQARVSFRAAAGETYLVQAGAFGEDGFDLSGQLAISFTQASRQPTVFKGSFRGHQAAAEWFSEAEQSFSDTFVLLTDGRSKAGPGKGFAEATLEVAHFTEEFDPATNTVTFTNLFGFVTLQPGQYGIDDRLREAFVGTDLTLEGMRCEFADVEEPIEPEDDANEECQELIADVSVSLTWEGRGGTIRSSTHFREHGDDFRLMFRSRAAARDATADGSITGDVDVVSGPADFAILLKGNESFLEWFRAG